MTTSGGRDELRESGKMPLMGGSTLQRPACRSLEQGCIATFCGSSLECPGRCSFLFRLFGNLGLVVTCHEVL